MPHRKKNISQAQTHLKNKLILLISPLFSFLLLESEEREEKKVKIDFLCNIKNGYKMRVGEDVDDEND